MKKSATPSSSSRPCLPLEPERRVTELSSAQFTAPQINNAGALVGTPSQDMELALGAGEEHVLDRRRGRRHPSILGQTNTVARHRDTRRAKASPARRSGLSGSFVGLTPTGRFLVPYRAPGMKVSVATYGCGGVRGRCSRVDDGGDRRGRPGGDDGGAAAGAGGDRGDGAGEARRFPAGFPRGHGACVDGGAAGRARPGRGVSRTAAKQVDQCVAARHGFAAGACRYLRGVAGAVQLRGDGAAVGSVEPARRGRRGGSRRSGCACAPTRPASSSPTAG